MYFGYNRVTIEQDQILRWTMQGHPGQNAGIEFRLQIRFITLPNGQKGFIIVQSGSVIPNQIDFGPQREFELGSYKGQVLFMEGCEMNITFEGEVYTILKLNEVNENGGDIYFHSYPPEGVVDGSTGDIIYSDSQHLESFIG